MKKSVSLQVEKLQTFWQKTTGLLGQKGKVVYFETRFGVHSFGMKYPIAVVILDNNNHIVLIKQVKPNRIFFWNPIFKKVLELPLDIVSKYNLSPGHKVILRE